MTDSVFLSLLNNVAAVLRRTRISNGQGGWIIAYTFIGTLLVRIRPASSTEQEVAQREKRQITHVLYAEYGADIFRGDKVVVGNLVVDVKGIREPSKAGHHLEIDCLEKQLEKDAEDES